MKTTNEILKMTHQELMNSSDEIRQMYREAEATEKLITATNLIAQGYKHLQFRQGGCIQKKKNTNGVFYVIKNGYGTGKVTNTFLTLKECITHLQGCGWGEIVSGK
jgi:RecA-family ATPase